MIEQVFRDTRGSRPVNTLCALAAESPRGGRSRGLAAQILNAMRTIGQRQGLTNLIAPVRPSWKERYPTIPIERYIKWRRADGQLLDPWMRVHERLGARVGAALPRSLLITGTVAEWETWTELVYPESGDYVFPEGLATFVGALSDAKVGGSIAAAIAIHNIPGAGRPLAAIRL